MPTSRKWRNADRVNRVQPKAGARPGFSLWTTGWPHLDRFSFFAGMARSYDRQHHRPQFPVSAGHACDLIFCISSPNAMALRLTLLNLDQADDISGRNPKLIANGCIKMKNNLPFLILLLVLTLITGCSKKYKGEAPIVIPKEAVQLEVFFSWEGIEPCTHHSPEIKVSGTPDGTETLWVKLKNITEPTWNQGGGKVRHDGSGIIPAGALQTGYNGPCTPKGQRYKYEFRVMALDVNDMIVGFGKARHSFPTKK
jgi:hypothetical protein